MSDARRFFPPIAVAALVFVVTYALWQPVPVGSVQDDGLYVILAKSLATGEGYRFINFPDAPHAAHYPPGYPAVLAVLWRVWPDFPANTALFGVANIVLLSVSAAAAFFLARRLEIVPRVAVLCVLAGYLMLPTLALGTTLLSEPLWLALAMPWLVWAERRMPEDASTQMPWPTAAALGAAAGVVMLVRTQAAPLVLGLLIALALRRQWRAAAAALVAAVIVVLPWQLWVARYAHEIPVALSGKYGAYGAWVGEGIRAEGGGLRLFSGSLRRNVVDALELTRGMLSLPGLPLVLAAVSLGLPAIAGGIRLARRAPVLLAVLCTHAAIILFFPFEVQRYVWGSWPFIALWLGAGFVELWSWRRAEAGQPATDRGLRRAASVFGLASIALVIAGAVVSTGIGLATGSFRNIARGGARRLQPTVDWVQRNVALNAVIASDDETAVYLYTGRRAVPTAAPLASAYARRATPDAQQAALLDSIVRRYRPDVVIVNWKATVAAAMRLSQGPDPRLRPITAVEGGAVFARVSDRE